MCEFKSCCGTGKCLLSKTSPCSGAMNTYAPSPERSMRRRSSRLSYPGFLDYQELTDILALADVEPQKERFDGLVDAAPKFLRAARAAIQSKKRSVA